MRGRKGQHLDVFQAIRRAGLIRARVDGEIVEVTEEPPKLAKTKVHHIEAVADRLVIREGILPRLAESLTSPSSSARAWWWFRPRPRRDGKTTS